VYQDALIIYDTNMKCDPQTNVCTRAGLRGRMQGHSFFCEHPHAHAHTVILMQSCHGN